MTFDLIIQGGTIVDGTGAKAYRADVGISGGRIAAIGDLAVAEARDRLLVDGRIVCPGFIDLHTHSDLSLLVCPDGGSKIAQGVTTEVIGNCGFSPAPLSDASAESVRKMHGFFGRFVDDLDWRWRSCEDFLTRLAANGLSLNVAPLVGHGTIRSTVMGPVQRSPTGPELADLEEHVRKAMRAGFFGLSTGLVYPPSAYADTEELVALARVAAEFGGIYASHIRGESHSLLRAVTEALEIGERAGISVEISHHKAVFRRYWGRMGEATRLSEMATERGQNVSFDVYPYTATSAGLNAVIPAWAHAGGQEALLTRLRDDVMRRRLKAEIARDEREWNDVVIAWLPSGASSDDEGRSVVEIADRRQLDVIDAVLTLLDESECRAMMVESSISEMDVRHVMRHPLASFGSDGWVLNPTGPLSEGKPHPRSYGTYPRILGHYVRDTKVLSMEEAVHKASYRPAEKLGLLRKGRIQAQADGDVVVFREATVCDQATYAEPHRFPAGIEHVVVGGQPVIRDGMHTGARPGRVLRHG